MTTCQVFIKIWIVSSVEFVDWKFPDGMRPYKSWIKCWLIYHWLIICHLRFTKIAGIRKIHFIQVLTCSDNFHHFRDICEASWKNTLSNRLEFHCSLFFYSNIYVKPICQHTLNIAYREYFRQFRTFKGTFRLMLLRLSSFFLISHQFIFNRTGWEFWDQAIKETS